MIDKDLKKVPIMDMFDLLINSEETDSLIEAIKTERGKDKVIKTKEAELEKRQNTLNNLFPEKKDKTQK